MEKASVLDVAKLCFLPRAPPDAGRPGRAGRLSRTQALSLSTSMFLEKYLSDYLQSKHPALRAVVHKHVLGEVPL